MIQVALQAALHVSILPRPTTRQVVTLSRGLRCASHVLSTAVVVIALASSPEHLSAAPPSVTFDCIPVIECVESPSSSASGLASDERVVEARLNASVLLNGSHPLDVEELLFTVTSPGRWLRVLDFSPKTELSSSVVGHIQVTENAAASQSIQAGVPAVAAMASAGIKLSHDTTATKSYQALPAKKLRIASGTIEAGSGVFFKIRPSPETSLEGSREFTVVFTVPRQWRAGVVVVSCQARGRQNRYLIPSVERTEQRSFVVALHLAGDEDARLAARKFVEAPLPSAQPVSSAKERFEPFISAADTAPRSSGIFRLSGGLPFSKKP